MSRALQKRAPFHLNKNSVADALLAELYAEVIEGEATDEEQYGFVTSDEDFSVQHGDRREPHSDLASLFDGSTSRYFYGIEGLQEALAGYLGDEFEQMLEESDFQEDPRTLTEILEAEQEFFDRVWFERSVRYTDRWESGHRGGRFDTEEGYRVSIEAQQRFKAKRPDLRACWQMVMRLVDLVVGVPMLRRGVRPVEKGAACWL